MLNDIEIIFLSVIIGNLPQGRQSIPNLTDDVRALNPFYVTNDSCQMSFKYEYNMSIVLIMRRCFALMLYKLEANSTLKIIIKININQADIHNYVV